MYVCIHICSYVYNVCVYCVNICIYICLYIFIVCVYVCVCVCVCVCACRRKKEEERGGGLFSDSVLKIHLNACMTSSPFIDVFRLTSDSFLEMDLSG